METIQELIEENLKDIHNAEKQFLKAMPKLVKSAQNAELKAALQTHIEETQEQIKRLEACMKDLGIKPGGVVCHGAEGIVEELTEHLSKAKPSPVTDAMIVGLAQKAEHYEICGYGTLLEFMKVAGMDEAVEQLKPNMAEEERTDQLLSQMAESGINMAAAQAEPAPEKKPAPKKSSSKASSGSSSSNGASDGKAPKRSSNKETAGSH